MTAISAKTYVVGDTEWIYPFEAEPPRGKKIHILQGGGMSITGNWQDGAGYLAWAELHRRNHRKEEVQRQINSGELKTTDPEFKDKVRYILSAAALLDSLPTGYTHCYYVPVKEDDTPKPEAPHNDSDSY